MSKGTNDCNKPRPQGPARNQSPEQIPILPPTDSSHYSAEATPRMLATASAQTVQKIEKPPREIKYESNKTQSDSPVVDDGQPAVLQKEVHYHDKTAVAANSASSASNGSAPAGNRRRNSGRGGGRSFTETSTTAPPHNSYDDGSSGSHNNSRDTTTTHTNLDLSDDHVSPTVVVDTSLYDYETVAICDQVQFAFSDKPVLCYTPMSEQQQNRGRPPPPPPPLSFSSSSDNNNNNNNNSSQTTSTNNNHNDEEGYSIDDMTAATANSTVLASEGPKNLPPSQQQQKDSSPTLTCIEPSPPGPPPGQSQRHPQQDQNSGSEKHHNNNSHHHQKSQKRRSIGDWDFVKTIGAGSMGQVKLAKNRKNDRLCAVKVIPKASHKASNNDSAKKKESDESKDIRSIREASICKLLHHKFIAELYEVHTMTNHFYMLFEFVSGGQLLDYIIAHGSLKEKQARKFARSIASSLDYLHRNSIVHRDLKIENILIAESGDIKLIDFGLSNLYSPNSLLKTFCGSLYFAAPELLNAHPYIGPEVDIWSFGIVLYVLVCGKVPFDDQSMAELHEKIKNGRVEYPDELSSGCVDLLSRMLVVNPQERAPLTEIMGHPWLNKGYDGPPDSYVPKRKPLSLPLDPSVTKEMAGFEFGSQDEIERSLTSILESAEYASACKNWYNMHTPGTGNNNNESTNNNTTSSPSSNGGSPAKKRSFTFDFYKRGNKDHDRDSTSSIGGGSTTSSSSLHPDPTNAYHPLISIYYLIQEKWEREHAQPVVEPAALLQPQKQQQQRVEIDVPSIPKPDPAATTIPRVPTRARSKTHGSNSMDYQPSPPPVVTSTPPPPQPTAVTQEQQTTTYTPPPQSRRNNQGYHQSHVSEPSTNNTVSPGTRQQASNLANSLLRKFSTKNKKPPSSPQHSAADSTSSPLPPIVLEQKRDEALQQEDTTQLTPTKQPQNQDHLNRSTSMKEGGLTPRQYRRTIGGATSNPPPPLPNDFKYPAPNTTTTSPTKTKMAPQQQDAATRTPSQSRKYHPSARAKSLGHTAALRKEQPAAFQEASQQQNNNNDDIFDDVSLNTPPSSESSTNGLGALTSTTNNNNNNNTAGTPSIDYPKQVFLKGFFSVQSTSTKSLAFIRSDIIRVLSQLGVEYKEIKGGFLCVHKSSIKSSSSNSQQQRQSIEDELGQHQGLVSSPPMSPQGANSGSGGGHWRKLSFGSGLFTGSASRKRGTESSGNILDSDISAESVGAVGSTPGTGGSDMIGMNGGTVNTSVRTPLRFECYIVKVPLLSLHGVQFKKLTGNSWQYKNLASKILSELRL